MTPSARKTLAGGALTLIGLWIYWPALRGVWLWDDAFELARNPELRDVKSLARLWVRPGSLDYLPLKSSLQWVQWHLWGEHVLGYHLTNLALHVLSAFLLFNLLNRLGRFSPERRPQAEVERAAWPLLGALLFLVHPIAVESVAWIAEFKNVLSLPLLLLAMLAWVDYQEVGRTVPGEPGIARGCGITPRLTGDGSPYLKALVCFLAAMLCKTSVVMFPAVLLLYTWWRHGRLRRSDLRASAPFFAISLGLGLVTIRFQLYLAQAHAHAVQAWALTGPDPALGGAVTRLVAAGVSAMFYACKCLVPAALMTAYPRWQMAPVSFAPWLPALMLGALVAWLTLRRRRHAVLGLGWFLLHLVPVLGFIPMAYLGISRVADRWAYLSLVGVAALGAAGFGAAWRRRRARLWLGWLAAAVVAMLAWQSRTAAADYRDPVALWTRDVRRNPDSWLGRYNLATALVAEGRTDAAIAQFRETLRVRPEMSEAHNNLAIALANTGQGDEARRQFAEAVRLNPGFAQARNNLGIALAHAGQGDEALRQIQEAVRLDPDNADARQNLGWLLRQARHPAEAAEQFRRAAELRARASGNSP